MSKVFMVVFLIFGTVVGSGFSSGKEIMVFFSRFGPFSYLYIILAAFLFFLLFYFFLSRGDSIIDKIKKYPFLQLITFFIALIFCSSMFAGIKNLFFYLPSWLYFFMLVLLIISCIFVTLKGIKGIQNINSILMPFTSIIFLIILIFSSTLSSVSSFQSNSWAGFLYSPLYVGLNTCMSGIIISNAGKNLNKKQTILASLFSTLLLLVFLLLGNFVLLNNSDSFFSEMPFLSINSGNPVSLCFTLKNSLKKICKGNFLASFISVLLPLCISILGFSHIISYLYPIASVLGIFILLFFILEEFFI